jgi:hypothetical protein
MAESVVAECSHLPLDLTTAVLPPLAQQKPDFQLFKRVDCRDPETADW